MSRSPDQDSRPQVHPALLLLAVWTIPAVISAGQGYFLLAYENNPQVLRFHLPGPHQFLSPFQKSSLVYEVAGIMNVGGCEVRLPKAIVYRDSF